MSSSSSETDNRSFPRSRNSSSTLFFSRKAFVLRHVLQFGLCKNLIFAFAIFCVHPLVIYGMTGGPGASTGAFSPSLLLHQSRWFFQFHEQIGELTEVAKLGA